MKRIVLGVVVTVVVGLASIVPVGATPQVLVSDGVPTEAVPPVPAVDPTLAIAMDDPGPFVVGEQVTIQVSGARNQSTVVVRQCDPAADACGVARYLTVGPSGDGTVSLVVRRRLPNAARNGFVDCGTQPCAFVAMQYGTELEATASLPMAVDPTAPVPRPTLRIVETEPLDDYATVTVEGTGYDPSGYVGFAECGWNPPVEAIPCAGLDGYGFVEPDGSFTATMRVSRELYDLDCAARFGRCQIWAFPSGSIDQIWAAQLGFDGTDPPVFPVVEVTPTTDLVHRQVVDVSGENLAPSTSVRVTECLATPPPPGEVACSPSTYVSVDAAGAFATPFTARRTIGERDCAVDACVIRVVGIAALTVDVPITFDPSIPPPPPPTVTVDPATGLADRQVVTVTVTDLDEGSYASAATCATGTESCRGGASLMVPPGGSSATTTMAVYRLPADGIDCAVVACEVRVMIYNGSSRTYAAPIAFDPDAPLADPPTMRVLPGSGIWDRQGVKVRGEGFDSGSSVVLRMCAGDPTVAANCEPTTSSWPSIGVDGRFEATFVAHRTPTLASGPVDCLVVACSIVASDYGGSLVFAVSPVSFDPNQPPGTSDLPEQLECVSWPTDGWPVGDIPAGVDAAAVEALGQQMIDFGGSSVVVIHGGKLVYENYNAANAVDENTILPSMSMSKSFTSTMVGLLVDDGVIDIDQPQLFPEWSAPGDIRGTMTTRHLLNMSSGLQWTEDYGDATSDVIKLVQSTDGAAYVVAKPAQQAPGTYWQYSTGDTMLLSRVIGDAAGVSGPTYEAMLQDRIFEPLGIEPVSIGFDDAGRWKAGWWTNTTTRNFAKLGLLYLRHGVWEDEQFLSTDWVDFVRTPAPGYSGYGGQFWLNGDGSFSMVGYGGQNVLIVPQLDLIVAVNNGGSTGSMAQLFANAAPASCGGDAMALADDSASVDVDGSVLVDVLANDDGGPSGLAPETLTVATGAANGVATIEGGAIRYVPDPGFAGTDSFDYLVCSTVRRPCLQATVQVTVGSPSGAGRR